MASLTRWTWVWVNSGSSRFTYCWSLAWRILSITLLACKMSTIVRSFEHSLALPFFGIGSGQHDLLLLLVLLLVTWKWFVSRKVPVNVFYHHYNLWVYHQLVKGNHWRLFFTSLSFSFIICKMEHVAYAMLLSEWIIFRLDITGWWINMTFRTPGSKVIHHITRLVTFATYPMLCG